MDAGNYLTNIPVKPILPNFALKGFQTKFLKMRLGC